MSVLNANECNEVLLVTVFYGVSKEKQRKKKVNGSQEASNGVLNPFFPSFTYKSHFARLSVGVCVSPFNYPYVSPFRRFVCLRVFLFWSFQMWCWTLRCQSYLIWLAKTSTLCCSNNFRGIFLWFNHKNNAQTVSSYPRYTRNHLWLTQNAPHVIQQNKETQNSHSAAWRILKPPNSPIQMQTRKSNGDKIKEQKQNGFNMLCYVIDLDLCAFFFCGSE